MEPIRQFSIYLLTELPFGKTTFDLSMFKCEQMSYLHTLFQLVVSLLAGDGKQMFSHNDVSTAPIYNETFGSFVDNCMLKFNNNENFRMDSCAEEHPACGGPPAYQLISQRAGPPPDRAVR